jgi:hypothetical protein
MFRVYWFEKKEIEKWKDNFNVDKSYMKWWVGKTDNEYNQVLWYRSCKI